MLNKNRLSNVLFLLSAVLLMYAYWFEVSLTPELMSISWSLLAISRAFLLFSNHNLISAEIKEGEEIKYD